MQMMFFEIHQGFGNFEVKNIQEKAKPREDESKTQKQLKMRAIRQLKRWLRSEQSHNSQKQNQEKKEKVHEKEKEKEKDGESKQLWWRHRWW